MDTDDNDSKNGSKNWANWYLTGTGILFELGLRPGQMGGGKKCGLRIPQSPAIRTGRTNSSMALKFRPRIQVGILRF